MREINRGHLKIFFSYADSESKTQAMLEAARTAKAQGVDVVVGYLAPKNLEAIKKKELEVLKPLVNEGHEEFDLDGALLRKPDLIVIENLAHTNAESCRHRRRYKDIEELQNAGIDVYTTADVSNIESLHDTVDSITGVTTWEQIPDHIFDDADQVEMIDVDPMELIAHLRDKDAEDRIVLAQMTALREVALQHCAERVKRISDQLRKRRVHTDEHVLVCISTSPTNVKIIRTAARMARAFKSQFTALFVETPDFAAADQESRQRLRDHQRLAEHLGAYVETVYGEDIAFQIAEFARLSGVTKIVLGRSVYSRKHMFGRPTMSEQLMDYIPETEIHIIPDRHKDQRFFFQNTENDGWLGILKNTGKSVGILVGSTLFGLLFEKLGFADDNIIMVYIVGVLLTSISTSRRIYSLISAVASVILFNFIFTIPRFSFAAYDIGYPVTLVIMFLTAYITATFAGRYKEQARQSARIARRTKILFDTDQLLSRANGREEIITAAAEQIVKLLERNIVVFEKKDEHLSEPHLYTVQAADKVPYDMEKELKTAEWVLKNNHAAGATTDTMSDAGYLYLALRVNERVYGVVGIEVQNVPLDVSERSILLSILGECALALENDKNAREKEAVAILAESEQLRANLLRAISHDLRTPLTSISGNASNLIGNSESFDEETKQQLYLDIHNDALWLINLVENLLSATRIEEGRMTLRTSAELLSDIVEEAVRYVQRKKAAHRLTVTAEDEFLVVKADAGMVVQVITNIVDNALKYTPPESAVEIRMRKSGNMAQVLIADTGQGIPDEEKEKIFEKFYCGSNKVADNRRSLGLGLYLCKAIMEAHGGTIQVMDNQPCGTVFWFTLPLEEIRIYE